MEWNDLRYFLAVCESGTLGEAARLLGVDQSTVGRRLAALEKSVGARLFDRAHDGYRPTAAASSVIEAARAVEQSVHAFERRLSGEDARLEGAVRLATTETFAVTFLLSRMAGLKKRHPGITVKMLTGNQPTNLARREADLSLRLTSRPEHPDVIARQLGFVAFGAYASKKYLEERGAPDPKDGFQGHDLVGYGEELATVPGARWMRDVARQARTVFTSNSIVALAAAIAGSLGVGVVPCMVAHFFPKMVRLPFEVEARREIWLVVHTDLHKNARVRAVADYLAEIVREGAPILLGESKKPR